MFKKLKNLISVIYTFFKFIFIKLLRFRGFDFKLPERFSPSTMINLHRGGKMVFGSRLSIHSGCRLSATRGAELSIGDRTAMNYNCILVARKRISIGKNCTFGPNVIVFDHDHDFRGNSKMNGSAFKQEDVIIGNNVWLGANVIVLKGSVIGDNAVVAAGTVVNGRIEDNSVAYNKKELSQKKYK